MKRVYIMPPKLAIHNVFILMLSHLFLIKCEDGGQVLTLKMFDINMEPTALCNDGTPGGYYFASAIDSSQSNVYVIYLPGAEFELFFFTNPMTGGGQCYDESSCTSRSQDMMSSTHFSNTVVVNGFLDSSPSKSPLWAANKAYLGYCSSDAYMGDIAASNSTWGYHFRGQSLVRAMVRALINEHNLSSASTIVFAGSSAGARGVMTHLDTITQDMFPPSALLVALLDSPYYLDIEPYSASFEGFDYQEQQKYLLYNTTGIVSAECEAAYPGEDKWKCQFGQYRMPFVSVPYFLIASQYDSYQLDSNIGESSDSYDDTETAYATSFGTSTRDSLDTLISSLQNRSGEDPIGYGIYSWACYNHAVGSSYAFYTLATNSGVTQKDAFEEFLNGQLHTNDRASLRLKSIIAAESVSITDALRVNVWIDDCKEFACGLNC